PSAGYGNASVNTGLTTASAFFFSNDGFNQLAGSVGTSIGDLRPIINDQSAQLAADFNAQATYQITSSGEPDGTLVGVTIRVHRFFASTSPIEDATYTIGSQTFTFAGDERTHTIAAKVGEALTFTIACHTSLNVTGLGPVQYTSSEVVLEFDRTTTP